MSVAAGLVLATVEHQSEFLALAPDWDGLVRSSKRPSPFFLHAWLFEWWRARGGNLTWAIQVAHRDGRLVGALPLVVDRRMGMKILRFPGGAQSVLGDVLVARQDDQEVIDRLVDDATGQGHNFADLFGMAADSHFARSSGADGLMLTERIEAPVLDMPNGWEVAYRERTTSKKRNHHKRRGRQLAQLGEVETTVARTPEELAPALDEAFELHSLRWKDRPDRSGFAMPEGKRFHHSALAALAPQDVPRIVTLRLDGRAIAFFLYLALAGRMYVYRLAFDPSFARYSPGMLNTLSALQTASDEGITRVEFLGAGERYKLELCDRIEPLYQGVGMASGLRGRGGSAVTVGAIRLRRRLRQSPALHRLYVEGLTPMRRALRGMHRDDGGHRGVS
jgi:CelD/BcsL family acetyltransferase involved in cellulose biosynthesis